MLPGRRPGVPRTSPRRYLSLGHLGEALPLRPTLQRNGASVREPSARLTVPPDHYPRSMLCAHCCWPSVQRSDAAPHRGQCTPRRALGLEPCRQPAVSPQCTLVADRPARCEVDQRRPPTASTKSTPCLT